MNIEKDLKQPQTTKGYFQFEKVDDYFSDRSTWNTISRATSYHWDESAQTLLLNLETNEGKPCAMLFQIATGSILRVRFHPEKTTGEDYTDCNTRSIVLDHFSDLVKKNHTKLFSAAIKDSAAKEKTIQIDFHGSKTDRILRLQVFMEPFSVVLTKIENKHEDIVFSTPAHGLKFKAAGGFHDYHIIQAVSKPATAKYVGFGEQGGFDLVKNNTRITYFNYDNMRYRQVYNHGPLEEREPLYHSDPFFIEVNAHPNSVYGIYVDNPSEVLMEMGYYKSSEYEFGIRYGDMDYYILVGDECSDIIKSFSNIIGTARLIPRYALGYHQGCYGYECRDDVEQVVESYRKYQIPLDGIHIDVDLQKDYKTFTIDDQKFPDPAGMFASLRAKGVKCSTNITPIISNRNTAAYSTYQQAAENGYFVSDNRYDPDNPDGKTYYKYASGQKYEYPMQDKEGNFNSGNPFIGEVYYGNEGDVELGTTGSYPDLNRKEVRKWWGQQYQYLFDMGLEMVWQDMTTPCLRDTRGDMLSFPSRLLIKNDFTKKETSDDYETTPVMRVWNLYSYNLHKATYHGLNHLKGRENKRNFIIGRGCFTGMQRFAGLWTGDNSSCWEFLKINISQILALGLTGQAISGQDIGGFERENDSEQWADPELLIRWTAMGAFLPWFRNHYIRKGKKLFQEPYEYQFHADQAPAEDRYLYQSVLPICKYYIELRYTLMQLFYDAMFENTLNGMPICRALFLTNPEDKTLFNDKVSFLNTEFMVRDQLLVAPVLEKGSEANGYGKRDVYLPAGNDWYQFTNHERPLLPKIEGGTTISDFDASIYDDPRHLPYIVPMYVKEGAIIPVIDLEQYVGEKNACGQANPIVLYVYPGAQGSYTMYLDDGVSRSSQPTGDPKYGADPEAKGEYREVSISHCYQSTSRRQILIQTLHNGYTSKYEKYIVLGLLDEPGKVNQIEKVELNGQEVHCMYSGTLMQLEKSGSVAWLYYSTNGATYIQVPNDQESLTIDVFYKE